MSAEAIAVFEEYIDLFNRAVSGEQVNPFDVFDAGCKFTCTGHSPISAAYPDLASVVGSVFGLVQEKMKFEAGFGFFVEEYFGDGDRMVALMRGRGESKLGRPYNNDYFFLFEVKDGKIVEAIEDMDASLVNWAIFDMNLEPADS